MPPITADDKNNSVGIIYPPPEVRNIVDKTATFVARNGAEFEQRIKQNEINNPKFNFLNHGDPYHAYYEFKVNEIREGKTPAPPGTQKALPPPPTPTDAIKQRQSDLLKQVQKEQEAPPPKDPPAEFEFIADPPSISAFDLDVVKLTAQFVARNGRQFLTNLMNREQRNYQFDFLRPQHSLFQYFTKLLEQYTKVLIPPKDVMKKLTDESKAEKAIKDQIKYRVAWIRHQEAKKRREEEEAERERVSYAQVDWHGFVVVETVDYQPWEVGNFPPPTNPEEVGARVIMQRRVEDPAPTAQRPKAAQDSEDVEGGGANMQVEDMDEGSSDEDEDMGPPPPAVGKPSISVDAAPAVQPPPSLPALGKVEVRQYDPKMAQMKKKIENEQYLISPITGDQVPADKVQEHMRIALLDPRWVEERDKQINARASEEAVFAPGQNIEKSLKHLAERRTDIFGVGEDAAQEAAIGKKMGEEEKRDDKVTWDGHSASAEAAARAARANISLNDQIEQIHRTKGLIQDSAKEKIGPAKVVTTTPHFSAPQPAPVPQQPPRPPPQQVQQVQAVAMMPVHAPPPPMMVPAAQPFYVTPQPYVPPPAVPVPEPEEPPAKRARGEDNLIPEGEFMARNLSPVTIKVSVPSGSDKPEWKLNGQIISLTLPLTDSVSVIKAKLHEDIGMPPGKQKLQMDTLFLKDSNSLAYYNMTPGTVLSLQIKERGGRKK